MKNLLRAGGAILALAAIVVALVFVFGTMDRSRGQPAATAPTPVPATTPQATLPLLSSPVMTPTIALTPRPAPSIVVDPTWPAPPTAAPRPPDSIPTPRPASGGPYISEAKAIEIALLVAGTPGNRVDPAVRAQAVFTQAKNVNAILGDPRPTSPSEREKWVVTLNGVFTPFSRPPGAPPSCYAKMHVVIDATTGEWSRFALIQDIPCN